MQGSKAGGDYALPDQKNKIDLDVEHKEGLLMLTIALFFCL